MRSIYNNTKVLTLFDPIDLGTGNTAKVSEIIDMQGSNNAMLIIQMGSIADADVTFTNLLEEGDNSSLTDAAAVAAADRLGTLTAATFLFSDDNKVAKIGYIGSKRYIRLTITPAANTGAILMSGAVVLNVHRKPDTTQLA